MIPQAAYILFGAAWTVLSATGLGLAVFRAMDRKATWPMAFLTGAPLLSLAVFVLGLAGFVEKGMVLALGSAALALGWRSRDALAPLARPPRWFLLCCLPFAALTFFHAMAPEISPDGMAYHLGLIVRYWREHRIVPVPESIYASLSQGMEMLFLFAYGFGRHSAAALVHWTCLLSLVLLMVDYGARRGREREACCAALLVAVSPIVAVDGASAYVDVAVAAVWFALYAILQDFEEPLALPAGLLAGFAIGVKYTAFVAVLYAVWRLRGRWRAAGLVVLLAAALTLPWIARSWLWTGNPFSPFANALFENPVFTAQMERDWSGWLRHYDIQSLGEWAWSATVTGDKLGGFLGPAWLAAPLGILHPAWIWAALTYPLNIGTRFLIPALPFLALGMARTLGRWPALLLAVTVLHAALSWPPIFRRYASPATWYMPKFAWKQALRLEPEESYLNWIRGEYRTARMIETFVPPGEQVFAFAPVAESYTTRNVVVSSNSARGQRIRDVLWTPQLGYLQPVWRHTVKLASPRRTVRITQTASHAVDCWSISEVEPRPAAIRVSNFPFSAALAIDGDRLTRWHSGRTLNPGMWVEFTFDRDLDTLTLWMTADQFAVRLASEQAAISEQQVAANTDFRREAAQTARRLGVRWIVVDKPDLPWRDMLPFAPLWGLTQVAERGDTKLLRIEEAIGRQAAGTQ